MTQTHKFHDAALLRHEAGIMNYGSCHSATMAVHGIGLQVYTQQDLSRPSAIHCLGRAVAEQTVCRLCYTSDQRMSSHSLCAVDLVYMLCVDDMHHSHACPVCEIMLQTENLKHAGLMFVGNVEPRGRLSRLSSR